MNDNDQVKNACNCGEGCDCGEDGKCKCVGEGECKCDCGDCEGGECKCPVETKADDEQMSQM